jgi:hydrogenase-4 component B
MTYTGTGFSNPVRVIFDAVFRPATQDERETVHEHFRTAIRRGHEDEFLPDRFIVSPLATLAQRSARTLARMHHGHLEAYVLYALTTLLALFLIAFLT